MGALGILKTTLAVTVVALGLTGCGDNREAYIEAMTKTQQSFDGLKVQVDENSVDGIKQQVELMFQQGGRLDLLGVPSYLKGTPKEEVYRNALEEYANSLRRLRTLFRQEPSLDIVLSMVKGEKLEQHCQGCHAKFIPLAPSRE